MAVEVYHHTRPQGRWEIEDQSVRILKFSTEELGNAFEMLLELLNYCIEAMNDVTFH